MDSGLFGNYPYATKEHMLKPADVFPKALATALRRHGEYVYAYYEPDAAQPFYVGKGTGKRVLVHWENALSSPHKNHEKRIRCILERGKVPQIQLLAYNLQRGNKEKRYAVAERVLQDAFGIKAVWEKVLEKGGARIKYKEAVLMQTREDSSRKRPRSLEAVVAASSLGRKIGKTQLNDLATEMKMPVLLVGLSLMYHPAYSSQELCEMARMYWNLRGSKATRLLQGEACLIAWSSHLTKAKIPVIVGAWGIKGHKAKRHRGGRYEFPAFENPDLRRRTLGSRLAGTSKGKGWEGPRIYLGNCTFDKKP
jgi:hypothetical protein